MGFFDDVRPQDDDTWGIEPHRQPDWIGPPENMAGATVVLDPVLANNGQAAVVLRGVRAFPTGVLLRVALFRRPTGETMRDTFQGFRFGVGLPDGRKLTDGHWHDEDATARLVERGGGGGGLSWNQSYWLWPLPADGVLQLACQWADEGIEETVIDVDTWPIREAARRAVELWPDERPVS